MFPISEVLLEFLASAEYPCKEINAIVPKIAKIVITTINKLLPLGFGPRDLGIDVNRYQKDNY